MNKFLKCLSVLLSALVIFSLTFVLGGCSFELSRTFFAADTTCTITLYDGDQAILDGAVDLVINIADKLNCKDENSEISKFNKSKKSTSPSTELLEVTKKGLYYSKLKDGVFDITVKPLSDLWNFKNETIPNKEDIAKILPKVDYNNLVITDSLELKNDAEIDLGGIAKGYIAQKAAEYLKKKGVTSAMINLGGNITLVGQKEDERFLIGIQTPFGEESCATLLCGDVSVVTSGNYQRYFEKNGVIYHHLLNTKSGMPQQNGLNSVTIISPDHTAADALSTLCFLLGKKEGMAYVNSLPNTEAIFIDSNNKLHYSSGLEEKNGFITIK